MSAPARLRRFVWFAGGYREVVLLVDRGPHGAAYELVEVRT